MARRLFTLLSGPLAPYAPGYCDELIRLGYAERTIASLLGLTAQLSVWLEGRGLEADALSEPLVEEFLALRDDTSSWRPTTRTLASLLGYLRGRGVTTMPAPVGARTPAESLCDRFGDYLAIERGLAEGTIENYVGVAGLFFSQVRQVEGRPDLRGLTTADVTEFVTREVSRREVGSAKNLVTGLRSLLGWLYVQGEIASALGQAVPGVAGWRGDSLPRALSSSQVERLLSSCDRRRASGRRDYAVLMLLVRLGLRAGEVAALQLEDLDWRSGEMVVRGKGTCIERLPLPTDVGEAVAHYLRQGRGSSTSRALFLRAYGPKVGLTAAGLASIVSTAGQRAGVAGANAHRLRHTAATQLLRGGGSLAEVALVLRHRSTATTSRYAKVDQPALRALVRPWPGGAL